MSHVFLGIILSVSQDRTTQIGKLGSNLVFPTRFKVDFYQG